MINKVPHQVYLHTLKVDKLSTPHSITASRPTGTVTFAIGPLNLGLSEKKTYLLTTDN